MVTKICPKCGKSSYVNISNNAYESWQFGISLQKAWPEGSASDREILISGLCKDCQEGVFDDELQRESSIPED